MRKVKLQMQITLDGFVAGPHREQDWMVWNWDDIVNEYVIDLTNSVDTMLVGRITYQEMENYWPAAAIKADASKEEIEFANRMNDINKVVFSNTLSTVEWNNSRLATNIVDEIAELKKQPGKDLIIYGGAGIVSSFIQKDLIDEYHLFINPVVLGKGMSIWNEILEQRKLRLLKTTASSVGIVILCYQPVKKD